MRTDRTRRGSGAVLLVVLWWTVQVGWAPTADADEVTPVFTTESWCAGYVETVPHLTR